MRKRQFQVLGQSRNKHPVGALFETSAICGGTMCESLVFLKHSRGIPLEGYFSP